MSGTVKGGIKAAKTNIKKYGKDYYRNIAKKASHPGTGGFASNKLGRDGLTGAQRAKIAGAKGGLKSRRGSGKRNKDGSIRHSYDYVVKHLRID